MEISNIGQVLRLEYEREEFLKAHPELRSFQQRIDDTLKDVGDDPILRCRILTSIMMAHTYSIQDKFDELRTYVKENGLIDHIDSLIKDLKDKRKELE